MKEYEAHRTVYTYAFLYSAARDAYNRGATDREGSFYQFMAAQTFCAFAFEAYLNHAGEKLFDHWKDLESLRPLGKLRVLTDRLNVPYNSSRRPIQTIERLMKFRNRMAHGKTAKLTGTVVRKMAIKPGETLLETDWESLCNQGDAERSLDDVMELIQQLHEAAGELDAFHSLTEAGWFAKPVPQSRRESH